MYSSLHQHTSNHCLVSKFVMSEEGDVAMLLIRLLWQAHPMQYAYCDLSWVNGRCCLYICTCTCNNDWEF